MRRNESLLQAIREAPDDDIPRLIYADWLDEHGESARAEFIRVQCRLAANHREDMNQSPEWAALLTREQHLLFQHAERWAAPLQNKTRSWNFRRGFIEQVVIETTSFLDDPASLFSLEPICDIHFLDAARWMEPLAACESLRDLTALRFSANNLGDEPVARLLRSPHLTRLQALYLERNQITDTGSTQLAQAALLKSLLSLNISYNFIADAGAHAIAHSAGLANLHTLNVGYNYIGMSQLYALRKRFGARLISANQNQEVQRQRLEELISRYPENM